MEDSKRLLSDWEKLNRKSLKSYLGKTLSGYVYGFHEKDGNLVIDIFSIIGLRDKEKLDRPKNNRGTYEKIKLMNLPESITQRCDINGVIYYNITINPRAIQTLGRESIWRKV